MGWLDTLLDVGILSLQIAEGKKLKDLQKQQAETALIQSVIQVLRNEIFNFKQSADEILLLEQKYPKIAAGAIQILDLQLSKSELHPDMFFELNDKEYVASTTRLIRENSIRLMSQLSAEEQAEVKGVVAAADTLPDFTYYMNNYHNVQRYKASLALVQKSGKWKNNPLMIIVGGLIVLSVTAFICSYLLDGNLLLGAIMGLVIVIALAVDYNREIGISSTREYELAQKTIEELGKQVDLEKFEELEENLGQGYEQVTQLKQRALETLRTFFGDARLPQGLTR